MRSIGLLVVALLVTLAGPNRPQAQSRTAASPSKSVQLTALDYFEIQQLYARYAHGMDTARDNGYFAADVFTTDGVYVDGAGQRSAGREALAELARRDPESRKSATNMQHLNANVVIDATPWGAIGRSYMLLAAKPLPSQPRGQVTDGGQYWDELVRTVAGWRIHRRTFVRPGGAVPVINTHPASEVTPGAARPSAFVLTAEDYAGIYRLYADYGYTFDTGSENGYGWANLYTPDGVHVSVVNSLEYIKGRDLIAAFAYGAYRVQGGFASLNRMHVSTKTTVSTAHIQTSILIEPTAEGVAAKPYRLTGALTQDDRVTLTPGGVYYDLLVKDVDRWRFNASWYLLPGLKVPDAIARYTVPTPAAPPWAAARRIHTGGLSPEDEVEIYQLYARSAWALDTAADNGNAYATLFTDDGALVNEAGRSFAGRAQLSEFARGGGGKSPTNVEHFLWQIKLDASPRGATGKAYAISLTLKVPGQPATILNAGQYRDDLVRTPEGWRFSKRTFYRVGVPNPA